MTTEPWVQGEIETYSSSQIAAELQKKIDDFAARASRVPDATAQSIVNSLNCWFEVAKILYLIEEEYNISAELIWDMINSELQRRQAINEELPDIPTFRLTFGVTEAAWGFYLYSEFPQLLYKELSKLRDLEAGIWGDLKGEPEDAALWVIERMIVTKRLVIPLVERWIEEHRRANALEAVKRIVAGILGIKRSEVDEILTTILHSFNDKLALISSIINELDETSWTVKAKHELSALLGASNNDLSSLSERILFELVIEASLSKAKRLPSSSPKSESDQPSSSFAAIDVLERELVTIKSSTDPESIEKHLRRVVKEAYYRIRKKHNLDPVETTIRILNETFRRFHASHPRDTQSLTSAIDDFLSNYGLSVHRIDPTVMDSKMEEFIIEQLTTALNLPRPTSN